MLRPLIFIAAAMAAGFSLASASGPVQTLLPTGWRLSPPAGSLAIVGTMPQGIALSPDGKTLAVVESGYNPPALRLLDAKTLQTKKVIPLDGAFGKPVWLNLVGTRVRVPGAATDAVLDIDLTTSEIQSRPLDKGSWPVDFSFGDYFHGRSMAAPVVITDDYNDAAKGSITFGTLSGGLPEKADWAATQFTTVHVGSHPAAALFSSSGRFIYTALRGQSSVAVVDTAMKRVAKHIAVGSHPCDLALSADGLKLYVAVCDDDAVAVIDTRTNTRVANIPVGLSNARVHGYGANPNALLVHGNDVFVSLGGENAVALIRNGHVAGYIPAGWYPTGLAMGADGTLYVSNGKGERAPPNPQFEPGKKERGGYVAAITTGSVRAIPRTVYESAAAQTRQTFADADPQWTPPPANATIIRAHGPIAHVIYVIKENRSYDQVLGDVAGANGDPSLAMFGRKVTPNQHALAQRFGIFDNAYADAQVSADGHNWTDAATANDYVERTWPASYGGRRPGYDSQLGAGADVPHSGYLWDAAKHAGITYRDYGEEDIGTAQPSITTFPALRGHYDPAYPGWNLHYSDSNRFAEWKREFGLFVARRNLPQFEIVYFPNDHTAGTSNNMPTPQAYVATNDWVTGQLVDAVSHSPYWKSTAIFVLEDDAQNGPDHVSDQRSPFYVASPYARGGVNHSHYSTVSVVRTIELILGLPSLSVKDATTRPMYDAFTMQAANAKPFSATKPDVKMDATNRRTAYGSAISARLDFSRPDAIDPTILNDILEHAVRH